MLLKLDCDIQLQCVPSLFPSFARKLLPPSQKSAKMKTSPITESLRGQASILLYKVQQVKWCAFSLSFCREGRALKSVYCPQSQVLLDTFIKCKSTKSLMWVLNSLSLNLLLPAGLTVSLHSFKVLTLHTQCHKCFWPLSPRLAVTILCHIADILSLNEKPLTSVYFSARRALFVS